jgi:hypothetical protein
MKTKTAVLTFVLCNLGAVILSSEAMARSTWS